MAKKLLIGTGLLIFSVLVTGVVILNNMFTTSEETKLVSVQRLSHSFVGLYSWQAWDGATWHIVEFIDEPPKKISYKGSNLKTEGIVLYVGIENHGAWLPVSLKKIGSEKVEFCDKYKCITRQSKIAPLGLGRS